MCKTYQKHWLWRFDNVKTWIVLQSTRFNYPLSVHELAALMLSLSLYITHLHLIAPPLSLQSLTALIHYVVQGTHELLLSTNSFSLFICLSHFMNYPHYNWLWTASLILSLVIFSCLTLFELLTLHPFSGQKPPDCHSLGQGQPMAVIAPGQHEFDGQRSLPRGNRPMRSFTSPHPIHQSKPFSGGHHHSTPKHQIGKVS